MSSLIQNNRTLFTLTLVLLLFGVRSGASQTGPAAEDQTSSTIAKIVEARDYTAQYVVLAKQTFKPDTAQYNQAFTLYADAYAKYGAWNAYVSSALRQGKAKKLTNNADYQTIASNASHSGVAFTNYVDSQINGSQHAVTVALASLADLGLKLWTGINTQITQERTTAANAFDTATKWQTWAQITDGASATPESTSTENSGSKSTSAPANQTGPASNNAPKAPH